MNLYRATFSKEWVIRREYIVSASSEQEVVQVLSEYEGDNFTIDDFEITELHVHETNPIVLLAAYEEEKG